MGRRRGRDCAVSKDDTGYPAVRQNADSLVLCPSALMLLQLRVITYVESGSAAAVLLLLLLKSTATRHVSYGA